MGRNPEFGTFNPLERDDRLPRVNRSLSALRRGLQLLTMGIMLSEGAVAQGLGRRQSAAEVFNSQMKKLDALYKTEEGLRGALGEHYKPAAWELRDELEQRWKNLQDGKLDSPQDLEVLNTSLSPESREEQEDGQLEVSELSGVDGTLSSEAVRKILLETYPKGWVAGRIGEVVQVGRDYSEQHLKELGLSQGVAGVVAGAKFESDGHGRIVFFEDSKGQKVGNLVRILGHEIAHLNDGRPVSLGTGAGRVRGGVPLSRRAEWHNEIIARLYSTDQHLAKEVGAIRDKADLQKELNGKILEYWGAICENYFERPGTMSVRDIELVDKYIRISDPTFNWQESKRRRDELVGEGLKKHGDNSQNFSRRNPRGHRIPR